MKTAFLLPCLFILAGDAFAATDVRVTFTLNTADPYGAALQQKRYYYIYRPDNLPKSTPVPAVLLMDGSAPAFMHRKADQAGFVVVSCSFSGNSTGTPGTVWNSENPRVTGYEDYDYIGEVINRIKASDNVNDVFTIGLSKGGHMSLAYACERPSMIKAAASIDEFMQADNIPTAPVPILMFQGTADTNVAYSMVKDTLDIWRATDGLLNVTPVTTYEASPLLPGRVSQATWRGGTGGTQVAFVTIISGTHTYPIPSAQTGYDCMDGMWAFFSQYLSPAEGAPKIVSQPVNNTQPRGEPATFWVSATGSGPLSYRWQKNGQDISGAAANWYTTPPVTASDNGASYQVIVSNDSGSVTSTAATLTVSSAPEGPALTSQPGDQTVVGGQPVTFSVTTRGAQPLRYQWKKNGVDIAGATADTLAIPAALTSDSGASFTVSVTNSAGSVTSSRATLTVTRAPGAPIVLSNPARQRVLVGQPATFSVTAWSASPMSYQWQKGTLTGNMADIPDATGATLTFPKPALADHLTLVRCVISNQAGSVTSSNEMLFVTAAPTPPTQLLSPIVAAAQTGVPFRYVIGYTGGTLPVTFDASPLPAGLSIDPNSGVISGIPSDAGVTTVVIAVSNSAGGTSANLTLTVADTAPAVPIDTWRLTNFGASVTDPLIAGDAADPDGDGYTNLDEFKAGTNPLDAGSVPAPSPSKVRKPAIGS